jgi:hypothetical protein
LRRLVLSAPTVEHGETENLKKLRRQKKARLEGRAIKGLEIFFVNEKVCFVKQNLQYSSTLNR